MPRRSRESTGGLVFHVMNRAARRLAIFERDADYALFIGTLCDARQRVPIRLLSYSVMPNHWHLVVWPMEDDELPRFMAWLTGIHARRWHQHRGSVGQGAVYQGRYRAIAVKEDHHFLTVCRYVERNPLKARLVRRASEWPWSSAAGVPGILTPDPWPVPRPADWMQHLDGPEAPGEFKELREAVRSGAPFGPGVWQKMTARRLNWWQGVRSRGRPRRP
jgi:putative transposase